MTTRTKRNAERKKIIDEYTEKHANLPPLEPRIMLPPRNRTSETKFPVLLVTPMGNGAYFINLTEHILEAVTASGGGFQSLDDTVITMSGEKNPYEYKDVKPNEAVRVEEYDYIFDSDFVLQIYINIKSTALGYFELVTPLEKGGVNMEIPLLWSTGECGKYVTMKRA